VILWGFFLKRKDGMGWDGMGERMGYWWRVKMEVEMDIN